ncbi:hypothetical protein P154DRAFT_291140 [Amniculicola lignicola CBS 123094]|uniref:Uncharacterized protein n=1 Tax=Amniculicola lignicola CBS 123094 TaxID=1392246 RepID=A0A6A5WWA2_9PLEO|nr:hypothetical protein P154DRAFT_291140 [Amniculicola lignicola CBS 123094]
MVVWLVACYFGGLLDNGSWAWVSEVGRWRCWWIGVDGWRQCWMEGDGVDMCTARDISRVKGTGVEVLDGQWRSRPKQSLLSSEDLIPLDGSIIVMRFHRPRCSRLEQSRRHIRSMKITKRLKARRIFFCVTDSSDGVYRKPDSCAPADDDFTAAHCKEMSTRLVAPEMRSIQTYAWW